MLGLVGAGGLGMALDTALSNLYWDQAGLVLFIIFAVVVVTEIATSLVRSRIIWRQIGTPGNRFPSG